MTICEMCGKDAPLVKADVEGTELEVCNNCAGYGTVKKGYSGNNYNLRRNGFRKNEKPEFKVVDNFASLIRNARDQKGMTNKDFAGMLNERESLVAKWENGSLKPRIDTARKIGKILSINLLEKIGPTKAEKEEKEDTIGGKASKDEFTLGDFIKVRKRK